MSNWVEVITALSQNQELTSEQANWAMTRIMLGEATDGQIAAFLIGLRTKSETTQEVVTLVNTMLDHCVPVEVAGVALDIVGTGGDHANTVNISTMASVVAAGAGAQVVKHGNRAVSSKSGAADLLEALGVDIEIDPADISELVDQVGIGFCFAPRCHPAMAHAAKVRRDLGVSTVFNLLGPLANPARPKSQVIGVADRSRAHIMAEVCGVRGVVALVAHSQNGLDEITSTAPFVIWDVTGEAQNEIVVDPAELGFKTTEVADLVGQSPKDNAEIAVEIFAGNGKGRFGAVRDAVLLTAAAGLVAHDAAVGVARPQPLVERLAGALERATKSLDSGAARAVLEDWVGYGSSANGMRTIAAVS